MSSPTTLFNGMPPQVYKPKPLQGVSKHHLTLRDKLKIVDFYHAHKARLTQQQVVTRIRAMGYSTFAQSTLSGYLKDEGRLRAYAIAHPTRLSYKQQTVVKLPNVEQALYQWILQKQGNGICLTGAIICEKAREFCRLLDVPEDKSLNFSNGWLTQLKACFGLRMYKFHGEAASAPIDTLEAEVLHVTELIHQYQPCNVFNADKTALFFRIPPNEGLATQQMSGVKADKIRLTYLLCTNMDGSEKLRPLVIGRARRPRCFGGVEAANLGFYYFWNSTAWMVQSIWQKFLFDLNAQMVEQNRHILLLVNNAPSHRHTPTDYSNVRVELLAPNLTAWIQPLDAGVICCFKAHYRNAFTRLALERDNAGIDKIYNITQLQAMNLALAAWERVTPTTIANCWRHTRLAPPILESSGGTHTTPEEDEGAAQEAEELTAEVLQHPNLLEPEFLQMMAALSLTYPTAPELTNDEIVGQVVLSANIV